MNRVTVRHNFETAHRLPHLGGKCRNLHGHSWWVEVTVAGDLDERGIVVDFGSLKKRLRDWIDTHLDHGAMLGDADPLVPALLADGSKLFQFGVSEPSKGLDWPTVENVADLVARVAANEIEAAGWTGVTVSAVRVSETHVNAAEVLR
ncbi:6-pyruvoyl trahydropterin synthase family protein [Marinitenerispora sediminis]|uniref:6-carboxy-5,6,7,8-tetrahydropterin synthase n=1 Tax=Marinitenerispora sediminis TaxID=1931232 RepID=A0A368T2H0_9ACTN|nr:6-carboxytetrahydropterin synthase [Marinitenerispora sediminis]RCV51920.1 6-pyruvoyl tetrahydrobiopterin synthase [Marinitenerispora sediminis]RCV52697.1 6-pyruvoyl tetrahydrobiopterin synthase [Marinitenerispora sediminis]RCV55750.1 6-pyruvoyl tetrahydrobiopterin synthase [Marinitenerispora sediminis]